MNTYQSFSPCSRCGEFVRFERRNEYGFEGEKYYRFNQDGSFHKCHVKVTTNEKWISELQEQDETRFLKQLHHFSITEHLSVPQLKLHQLRHSKKVFNDYMKDIEQQLEYRKTKILLLQSLMAEQWPKMWVITTHSSQGRGMNYFMRWFKDYYEMMYPLVCSWGCTIEKISRYAMPEPFLRDDVANGLFEFKTGLNEILAVATKVQQISDGNFVKREKDFWLRQVTEAYEWKGKRWAVWKVQPDVHTIALDIFEVIEKAKKRFLEAYTYNIAEINGQEDHGWAKDGSYNWRIQEGLEACFASNESQGMQKP